MTKIVNSSEYSTNAIFVGCSVNEDGEPLVEVNGKAVGTVAGLLDFLGKYEGQQKATVNVRWAASAVPDGFLGPQAYKMSPPYQAAALLMDVPVNKDINPGDDAYMRISNLQRELDDLKASLPRRVEDAIASARRRNVRPSL